MAPSSAGSKLRQARLAKQISVEEASRVTRIRPDRLIDLEEDNYSNFPSMTYAKGFLHIYARYLGVDVREYAEHLHAPNPVSTDDYEYLNAAASPAHPSSGRHPYHFAPRRKRTLLPVIVFALLITAVMLGVYLVVSFQRLGNLEDVTEKKEAPAAISAIPAQPLAAAAASALPAPSPVAAAAAPAAPELRAQPPPMAPAAPAATFDPTREVRRAEPVQPIPAPPAAAAASPAPDAASPALAAPDETLREVAIRPLKKTRVTVRQDAPDSVPVFEDWLSPGDPPLQLHGHKFFIQVADPGAVEVTRDGQALPSGQTEFQIE